MRSSYVMLMGINCLYTSVPLQQSLSSMTFFLCLFVLLVNSFASFLYCLKLKKKLSAGCRHKVDVICLFCACTGKVQHLEEYAFMLVSFSKREMRGSISISCLRVQYEALWSWSHDWICIASHTDWKTRRNRSLGSAQSSKIQLPAPQTYKNTLYLV